MIGHAEVRNTFKVSKVGTIAGCMVTSGKIARNAEVRLIRDGIVVHEGKIDSPSALKMTLKKWHRVMSAVLPWQAIATSKKET